MLPKVLRLGLLYVFLFAAFANAHAQDDPFSCFNAQEIRFPLGQNDFSNHQVLMNENTYNALYYLYEDKYSFWYKFIATENIKIEFSVSPSNKSDRYRAVAFDYGKPDFCDVLINEGVKPLDLIRVPIYTDEGLIYKNVIHASAGDTIQISVLSLNREDCGHFLYMEANGEQMSIHAIHRPCYDFTFLEAPDFLATKMHMDEPELELNLDVEPDTLVAVEDSLPSGPPEPTDEYAALTSIEVQQKEKGVVNVGDKLVLNQVFFYNNTYAFKPEAEVELNQLLVFMQVNEEVTIEIQGHTANNAQDIRPDPNFKGQGKEWNFKGSSYELSEMRAEAVKDFLTKNGIDKKRLKTVGYGDTMKRVPDAKTFEESERNMRVEVLITEQ